MYILIIRHVALENQREERASERELPLLFCANPTLFSTDSYDNQLAMGKLDAYLTAAAARVEWAEGRGQVRGARPGEVRQSEANRSCRWLGSITKQARTKRAGSTDREKGEGEQRQLKTIHE